MIVYVPQAPSAAAPVATASAHHAVSGRTFQGTASGGTPPTDSLLVVDIGDSLDPQPEKQAVLEHFNWSNETLNREFIRLEQKVLARKATQDELERYGAMKQDRNSGIFADRYLRDYAEIQRLRKLSEKLAEVQRYLRPVSI
ncbi:MAG TPA: hypothetical protein VNT99_18980 [Methylomirabilota bacterium]|nr:hypothetical protein [Methylomirabilota bacterium]